MCAAASDFKRSLLSISTGTREPHSCGCWYLKIETAIMLADVVLIPVAASIFDAGSLQPIIDLARIAKTECAADVGRRYKD
jgi:hypothetical protein